jgi:hypothetical protein
LVPRPSSTSSAGQELRTAVLLDTETTGLDARKDEIIELGMLKFGYLADGRIAGVRGTFSAFNEPTGAISDEVVALTGITDEMVAGHRIDDAAVNAFVDDAAIVIAHNSTFDRKFVERYWTVVERKPWSCSATEIECKTHGFAGAQLGYLLNGAGYFHAAHRASTIAMRFSKSSRSNYRRPARRRSRCCWKPPEGRRCAFGPSNPLSNSRIRSRSAATAGTTAAMAGRSPGTSTSAKASSKSRSHF